MNKFVQGILKLLFGENAIEDEKVPAYESMDTPSKYDSIFLKTNSERNTFVHKKNSLTIGYFSIPYP